LTYLSFYISHNSVNLNLYNNIFPSILELLRSDFYRFVQLRDRAKTAFITLEITNVDN